ncbi:MAG: TetR/AcrR family transcriptional regulator [Sphaerochaetaceae bacterium]|nr:TetR/AcrR family transcriptional regulator [Sphaerochaetaceae bacterium]
MKNIDKNRFDLRVQKTEKSLLEAFYLLMKQKNFEEITVDEICRTALVSRPSFYSYFEDKYDFFSFATTALLQRFSAPSSGYVETVTHFLDFLEENEDVVTSFYRSSSNSILMGIITENISAMLSEHVQRDIESGVSYIADPQIIVPTFTGALTGVCGWWVASGKKVPKEEIADALRKMLDKLIN